MTPVKIATGFVISILIIGVLSPLPLWAHGVVGKRFFPAGITVDDPFAADELTLASPSYLKTDEGKETAVGFEVQKRLSENLGFGIEAEYVRVKPSDSSEDTVKGFNNPEFSLIYVAHKSPDHEFLATTALHVSPGGVGKKGIREDTSHVEPALVLGKGLGDLPDSVWFLRPIALVGQVTMEVPWGNVDDPEEMASTLNYGLVVEYSIPYLQSFVKDVGIPWPFKRLFPIVEFTYSEIISGPDAHSQPTGYVNPGILWAGKKIEYGIEAIIPVNDRSGKGTGVVGLVHLFMDDIAPDIFSWTPFSGTMGPTQRR
jgi:hypothetical protein